MFDVFVPVPPSISGISKLENIEVIENHTAYLSCPVTGTPQPTIMWFRNNVPLFDVAAYKSIRELNGGQTLELRNIRVADEAIYKCQASNVAGQRFKNFRLKVLG